MKSRILLPSRNMRLGRRRHKAETTSADWKLSKEAFNKEIQERPREPTERDDPESDTVAPGVAHL